LESAWDRPLVHFISMIDFAYKRKTSALVKYFITRTNNKMWVKTFLQELLFWSKTL